MNEYAFVPKMTPKAAELKTVLMILDHVEEHGPSIERMKVRELPVWRFGKVAKLASSLDRVFRRLRRATAADDSIESLAHILLAARSEGRDMAWLGDRIKGVYRFPGNGAALLRRVGPTCVLAATPSGILAAAR